MTNTPPYVKLTDELLNDFNKRMNKSINKGIMEMMKRVQQGKPAQKRKYVFYKSYIKFAWVIINGKKEMIGVHNVNMKGYAFASYCTLEMPLREIKYDSFERWVSMMEV